jgi:hypothetical protein
MMEEAGYIEIPKSSKDPDDAFDWWGFQMDQIIPAISVDSTRFYPVIEEEIDDFIFEEAPHLRSIISITPEGMREFVNTHEDKEFTKKLIDALLPMSYRHKALAFDWPGFNHNLFIEIDEWLAKGNVSYKKQPLTPDEKKATLKYIDYLFHDRQ